MIGWKFLMHWDGWIPKTRLQDKKCWEACIKYYFFGFGGGVKMGLLDKTILIYTFIVTNNIFSGDLPLWSWLFFRTKEQKGNFLLVVYAIPYDSLIRFFGAPLLWVTSRVYTNTGKNPWMNNWENLKNGESANNRVIIRGIRIRQISRMLSNMYKNICSFGNNTRHEL